MTLFFHSVLRVNLPKDAGAHFREVETRTALLNLCGVTIVSKRMI
jgi:hypothetical protein